MINIDNILLEWSYRCKDGIVDVENQEKVLILKEILQENGYVLVAGNISPDLNSPYEDWWVNPKYVSEDTINKMKNVDQEVLFAKDYMFKYLS